MPLLTGRWLCTGRTPNVMSYLCTVLIYLLSVSATYWVLQQCFLQVALHVAGKKFGSATAFSIHCKRMQTPNKQGDDGWKSTLYDGQPLENYRRKYLQESGLDGDEAEVCKKALQTVAAVTCVNAEAMQHRSCLPSTVACHNIDVTWLPWMYSIVLPCGTADVGWDGWPKACTLHWASCLLLSAACLDLQALLDNYHVSISTVFCLHD